MSSRQDHFPRGCKKGVVWRLFFPDCAYQVYATKVGAKLRQKDLRNKGIKCIIKRTLMEKGDAICAAHMDVLARGLPPFRSPGKEIARFFLSRLLGESPPKVMPFVDPVLSSDEDEPQEQNFEEIFDVKPESLDI